MFTQSFRLAGTFEQPQVGSEDGCEHLTRRFQQSVVRPARLSVATLWPESQLLLYSHSGGHGENGQ